LLPEWPEARRSADRAASATLTITLRNSSGDTMDTASQAITITD